MEDALVLTPKQRFKKMKSVLILVVMEDALVLKKHPILNAHLQRVLILVVMEDALVLLKIHPRKWSKHFVLILVVMEDALVPAK